MAPTVAWTLLVCISSVHLAACSVSPTRLPPLRAAVIVPGFLSDVSDFEPLAKTLSQRGLPTAVVPMRLWEWLPTVGGRSVRPVLQRIDHAVRHVAAMAADADEGTLLQVPPVGYGLRELATEFWTNPGGPAKVGGSIEPDEYPHMPTLGQFPEAPDPQGRVAIIGHSAGGYLARIFLSDRPYAGKAFCGSGLVHSLVTLGTPHAAGGALPFVHVAWANREPLPASVRALAIGATGTPGDSSGSLTRGAYSFCTLDGVGGEALDGDGITTADSAVALAGADTLTLEGVTHYPWTASPFADLVAPELTAEYRAGKPWYGDEEVLEEWLPWLLANCGGA